MQDGRLVQEGQPYEIINCGNISFVPTLDAVLECCRIFEAKLARAADGVDLDPESIDGVDNGRFPDFCGVPYPDALAGLGHSLRVDLQPTADTGQIGNYSTSRATPDKGWVLECSGSVQAPPSPRNRRFTLPVRRFCQSDPEVELAAVRH